MVLPHSKESDSRRDSQKPVRVGFPTRSFLSTLPSLLGFLTTKKFDTKIVAKKKVILKPRLFALMDFLVVIQYMTTWYEQVIFFIVIFSSLKSSQN